MPRALDYREIDQAILSNPDRSANEIRSLHQLKCSHTTVCRRMLQLGVRAPMTIEEKLSHMPKEIDTARERVTCKCPKCRKQHTVSMFWTGNGQPRCYCDVCKRELDRSDFYETVETIDIGVVDERFDLTVRGFEKQCNRYALIDDSFLPGWR